MRKSLIGYDIGGTKCAVILGYEQDDKVFISKKIKFPTNTSEGYIKTLEHFKAETLNIIKSADMTINDISAIGISCGGPLDSKKGVVYSPPNLPGWDEVEIVKYFGSAFSVPVKVQNDANACALAEWKWGAGKGADSMIFMTFGTGLGAGLILDGRLYCGANDMAGEIGHIRLADDGPFAHGKHGSFEGFCSGSGITKLAQLIIRQQWRENRAVNFCKNEEELEAINPKIIADAAKAGNKTAIEIYRTTGTRLGEGLAILIDILNPERIVIGSVFERQHDLIWQWAKPVIEREALARSAKACKVVPAKLGEAVGDYAALSVATL